MSKFESAYTGRLMEEEALGSPDREKIDVLNNPERTYLTYRQAMEAVKKMQPFDPSDPDPPFANDLHTTVAERLGLADYSQLGFFTALGSHLDFFHGVDAFFELRPEKGRKIEVTLDITKNPLKDVGRADVLISMPDEGLDPKDDRKMYLKKLEETAKKIVAVIRRKTE